MCHSKQNGKYLDKMISKLCISVKINEEMQPFVSANGLLWFMSLVMNNNMVFVESGSRGT